MDDRASVKQLSSVRLQKAISKNQIFDTELQKELQVLEIKKKASEKAFELKRTQFLKNRLCREPLKKSHSFHRTRNERQLIFMNEPLDLRSSYLTGNLLESLRSPRKDQSWGIGNSSEQSTTLYKKFNLDVAKNDTGKKDDVSNWGKTFEKPMGPNLTRSSSYNHVVLQGTEVINDNTVRTDRRSCSDATSFKTLKVPSIANMISSSDDTLPARIIRQDTYDFQRRERLKSWHASNRMTISPITKLVSQKDESQGLSREDESGTKANKHLSLPPLKRTRSKSLEIVRAPHEDENVNEFHKDTFAQNAHSLVSAKTLFGSETNVQRSKRNLWVSKTVFELSSKKSQANDDGKGEGKENLKPKKTERSTSTPDLMDIEPEVEYLLMRDDKIRLQRMRASVHAIRLMSDMKDYRYIRNVEFTHQNKREPNSSPSMVSGENQPSHDAQIGVLESEALENHDPEGNENDTRESRERSSNNPALEPRDVEDSGHDEKPNLHSGEESSDDTKTGEDALNRSTDSSLAEMFEEIRHTRYLRLRSRMTLDDGGGGGDEVDNDECNIPYGRVPLIIVGHTKAVLHLDGEDL